MIDIIVVFPKLNDGQGIRNLLVRNGYRVATVCTSGSQAMSFMDNIDYGIVVCGYKFNDMVYSDLYQDESIVVIIQVKCIAHCIGHGFRHNFCIKRIGKEELDVKRQFLLKTMLCQ